MTKYPYHPLAEIFPMMTASEMTALANDIKTNGLANPITLFEGKILDGRHRHEACLGADVKPRFVEFKGDDPMAFVIGANLKRRHLTEAQRAMVAAKLENTTHGGDRKDDNQDANLHLNREEAAKTLNISTRSVATASKILDESPRLAKQVSNGKISLNAASKQIAEKAKPSEPEVVHLDKALSRPIPIKIVELWNRSAEEGAEMLRLLSAVRCAFRKAQEDDDRAFAELNLSGSIAKLDAIYSDTKSIMPYAVCSTCQGMTPSKCTFCKGRGFISEFYWKTHVPKETKELIARGIKK